MSLSPEAWTAIGVAVSAITATISTVGVARINATKRDVGRATEHAAAATEAAAEANEAAVEARELARPTGNGYADKTTSALDRIEQALRDLSDRQVRTNAWLIQHLSDHAAADVRGRTEPTEPH